MLSAAKSGKAQRERCLELTYEKIDYFETVFGGMTIGRYINGLISQFQTREKYNEISDFFTKHPIKAAERSIKQGKTIALFSIIINFRVQVWKK